MSNKPKAFTFIEVMITVAILALLTGIVVVMVGGLDTKAKTTKTIAQMKILSEAVTAFKSSTGYFPLSVSNDAWGDWTNFVALAKWDNRWTNYFKDPGIPHFLWETNSTPTTDPKPTNIHMLAFQLEQVPKSRK